MKKLFGLISIAFAMFSCGDSGPQAVDLEVVNSKIIKFTAEFDSIFVNNYDRPVLSVLADSILTNIEILRKENGWKTGFIKGLKVQHNRDTDEDLAAHRTL